MPAGVLAAPVKAASRSVLKCCFPVEQFCECLYSLLWMLRSQTALKAATGSALLPPWLDRAVVWLQALPNYEDLVLGRLQWMFSEKTGALGLGLIAICTCEGHSRYWPEYGAGGFIRLREVRRGFFGIHRCGNVLIAYITPERSLQIGSSMQSFGCIQTLPASEFKHGLASLLPAQEASHCCLSQVWAMAQSTFCPHNFACFHNGFLVASRARLQVQPKRLYQYLLSLFATPLTHPLRANEVLYKHYVSDLPEWPTLGHVMERSWNALLNCTDPEIADACDVPCEHPGCSDFERCQCLDPLPGVAPI